MQNIIPEIKELSRSWKKKISELEDRSEDITERDKGMKNMKERLGNMQCS